ncbi:putative NAD dependent epimerase/dehydratase [Aspergillus nomiae NRRL 13137]|uniref:Putative NAD dependent epimerase/dehydratase n=1 Tax=Aspergillus nomiae NRRL (strain ATCC 15546 / NRRL 13137 / CBS 260.88 / M93) TaxID=1509407 RepID=A0A0L1J3U0_ASPN3|nr:putative NAD dependent epimerase/dehydratase [Aspergillus nomiae NRRL 13137]KNG86407.1 putative NAD dependent epimerase/dehydratase [Aspergillus nomiae NRRL 13137]
MQTPKTILVTGASGFVAAHIIEAFISAGYHVRGTVRSAATAEKVKRTFPRYSEELSFAIVPDIVEDGAFDEAVKGVDGIMHTACPGAIETENNKRDIVQPAINGTINILQSARKHAPQIKRIVITSSFASMIDMSKGTWPGHVYSEKDWNPMTYEEAVSEGTTNLQAYLAAKKVAERAAWNFVRDENTSFDLVTILPPIIYGPNIIATHVSQLNVTSADLYRLMSPDSKPSGSIPDNGFWSWVDVRDVAQAHLKAYEVSEAGGERFFICAGNYSYQQIADIWREKVPEVKDRVPLGKPGSGFGDVELYTPDARKSQRILGLRYRGLEESVVDSAYAFLELEKQSR